MSCERNITGVGNTGARAAGISALQNRAVAAMGTAVTTLKNLGDQSQELALRRSRVQRRIAQGVVNDVTHTGRTILGKVDELSGKGNATAAALLGVAGPTESATAVVGSTVGKTARFALDTGLKVGGFVFPPIKVAAKIVNISGMVSGIAATQLAGLSKTGEAGQVERTTKSFFFFKKRPVTVWKSSLTGYLNQMDAISGMDKVTASRGEMFSVSIGSTWHCGRMTLKNADGQSRAITHLQSLSIPPAHYYFSRDISREQAVGVATGDLKPEDVPGYAGQITASEALCPAWAAAKQTLIKGYLRFGPKSKI